MPQHLITKYEANGKKFAASWIQVKIFGKILCLSRKVIELKEDAPQSIDILFRPRSQMRG